MRIETEDKKLWLDLYEIAEKIKKLAPWRWMNDDHILAVEIPRAKEIAYCSVMGQMGTLFGINIYLGDKGLNGYFELLNTGIKKAGYADNLFNQKCLQVFYTDRDTLTDEDRRQIKELGLSYRGKNQWIQFREISPGMYPWYISESQASFLKVVLEQVFIVTERLKDDPELLFYPNEEDLKKEVYFIRKTKKENGKLIWKDDWLFLPPGGNKEKTTPPGPALKKLADKINRFSQRIPSLTCFILPMNNPVMDEKMGRPYFPLCVLWLDSKNKLIIGSELCKIQDLDVTLLHSLLNVVETREAFPRQIIVPNLITLERLTTASDVLNIPVKFSPEEERELEFLKKSMGHFFKSKNQ